MSKARAREIALRHGARLECVTDLPSLTSMLNTDTVRESFLEGKTPINQWRGDQHAGMVYTERKLLLPDHCFSPFNFASGIYASLVVIAFLSFSLSLCHFLGMIVNSLDFSFFSSFLDLTRNDTKRWKGSKFIPLSSRVKNRINLLKIPSKIYLFSFDTEEYRYW